MSQLQKKKSLKTMLLFNNLISVCITYTYSFRIQTQEQGKTNTDLITVAVLVRKGYLKG